MAYPEHGVPKYIQVYNNLLEGIRGGTYSSGSKLPSESELIDTFGVSRQTIRTALEKLREDGYIYSMQGSGSFVNAPIRVKTGRIAHVSIRISDYVFPRILSGMEEYLTSRGYSLVLYSSNNSLFQERQILQSILENPVDGVIISGTKSALPNPNLPLVLRLMEQRIPIVFINSLYRNLNADSCVYVVMDDFDGGYRLGEYLFDKGITNVGGIFKADDRQSFYRYSGFLSAAIDRGISFNDTNCLWFSSESVRNYSNLTAMFEKLRSCEALLCYNDEVVRDLLPEAEQFPWEQLKYICSFDHIFEFSTPIAKCVSIGHAGRQMGRIAAEKVLSMIEGISETPIQLPWDYSRLD